jgi:hypothetical protein
MPGQNIDYREQYLQLKKLYLDTKKAIQVGGANQCGVDPKTNTPLYCYRKKNKKMCSLHNKPAVDGDIDCHCDTSKKNPSGKHPCRKITEKATKKKLEEKPEKDSEKKSAEKSAEKPAEKPAEEPKKKYTKEEIQQLMVLFGLSYQEAQTLLESNKFNIESVIDTLTQEDSHKKSIQIPSDSDSDLSSEGVSDEIPEDSSESSEHSARYNTYSDDSSDRSDSSDNSDSSDDRLFEDKQFSSSDSSDSLDSSDSSDSSDSLDSSDSSKSKDSDCEITEDTDAYKATQGVTSRSKLKKLLKQQKKDYNLHLFTTIADGTCMYDSISRGLKGIVFPEDIVNDVKLERNPILGDKDSNLKDPTPLQKQICPGKKGRITTTESLFPEERREAINALKRMVSDSVRQSPWLSEGHTIWVDRISAPIEVTKTFPDRTDVLNFSLAKKYKTFMDAIYEHYNGKYKTFIEETIQFHVNKCLEGWLAFVRDTRKEYTSIEKTEKEAKQRVLENFVSNYERHKNALLEKIHGTYDIRDETLIKHLVPFLPDSESKIKKIPKKKTDTYQKNITNALTQAFKDDLQESNEDWAQRIRERGAELLSTKDEDISLLDQAYARFAESNVLPDDIKTPKDKKGVPYTLPERPLRDVLADAELEIDFWGNNQEAVIISKKLHINIIIVREEKSEAPTTYSCINVPEDVVSLGTILVHYTGGHYRGVGLPTNDNENIQYFFYPDTENPSFKFIELQSEANCK